jgi:NADP-dependent 3-hydroxy acid dehydrogenase YdfG
MQKYAIVTGASRGVGYATCKLLAANGYKVIGIARSIDKLKTLVSENIEVYQLDMTNFEEIKKFAEKYKDIELDLLVNNAGGGSNPTKIIEEDPNNFNYAYSLNVSGPMYLSKLFTPNLKKSKSPAIIFISSLGGKFPYRGGGNYTTAKRAIGGLIDLMRAEYGEYNIRITEICPGSIDTVETEERGATALSAVDMAEVIKWVFELPKHININHIDLNHISNRRY